jgi:hypothetical protein
MRADAIESRFRLKCGTCAGLGVPSRVDLHTPAIITIALRCSQCQVEWIAKGDLPVFLAWVKPARERSYSLKKQKQIH